MESGTHKAVADHAAFVALSDDERVALLDGLAAKGSKGDTDSLDGLLRLVDEHRLARPSIRRLVVNDADVDDVNQDVLIRISQNISSYRGDARFTTWLYSIARNAAIDFLRRQREHDTLADDDRLSAAERVSSMIATRNDLQAAVDALPEHYRVPLQMRDMEGHSYEQIADSLGIELNTVRSRIARGRALVATSLQPAKHHS